jgi:hypothetical protein
MVKELRGGSHTGKEEISLRTDLYVSSIASTRAGDVAMMQHKILMQ